jgi:hypothetical protein
VNHRRDSKRAAEFRRALLVYLSMTTVSVAWRRKTEAIATYMDETMSLPARYKSLPPYSPYASVAAYSKEIEVITIRPLGDDCLSSDVRLGRRIDLKPWSPTFGWLPKAARYGTVPVRDK